MNCSIYTYLVSTLQTNRQRWAIWYLIQSWWTSAVTPLNNIIHCEIISHEPLSLPIFKKATEYTCLNSECSVYHLYTFVCSHSIFILGITKSICGFMDWKKKRQKRILFHFQLNFFLSFGPWSPRLITISCILRLPDFPLLWQDAAHADLVYVWNCQTQNGSKALVSLRLYRAWITSHKRIRAWGISYLPAIVFCLPVCNYDFFKITVHCFVSSALAVCTQ